MSKRNQKDNQNLSIVIQWTFLVVGTLLAFFISISANALYGMFQTYDMSNGMILFTSFIVILFFGHLFSYMILNLKDVQGQTGKDFLMEYMRRCKFIFLIFCLAIVVLIYDIVYKI